MKKLLLVELNELNMTVVREYLAAGLHLPGFKKLFEFDERKTKSEDEHRLLEPWIQWPSVHTGRPYAEHRLFRLGDAELGVPEQIFEKVESLGFCVGAVSPMNAVNLLKEPAYFIPDPWTRTPSDQSLLSKVITPAIRQSVNDNSSGRITVGTYLRLFFAFLVTVRMKSFKKCFWMAFSSIGKPWRKAIFLDLLLHEIHGYLFRGKDVDFSVVFFNAGAHIQHHYFFNSISSVCLEKKNPNWYVAAAYDPLKEVILAYDGILSDLFQSDGVELVVATGLTQSPVDAATFYYRLDNHEQFLSLIGVPFKSVAPRMTRDFLVECFSEQDAADAEIKLRQVRTRSGSRIFEEIVNRGKDLFVVLTHSAEITPETQISISGKWVKLLPHVVFVAIKNGEHTQEGFAYFSHQLAEFAPSDGAHVSKLHDTILSWFQESENRNS